MEKEIVGLPTGFKALDEKLGGLRKGEVVVIASRPSVGKTSLAMNVAECLSLGHLMVSRLSAKVKEDMQCCTSRLRCRQRLLPSGCCAAERTSTLGTLSET